MPSPGPRIVAVVGPTASGKSKLALDLAKAFHGQIVSADSRQVYRHMDIGTAKPSPSYRQDAPHHLYDLIDPDQRFDLAAFLDMARKVIDRILDEGELPIVAGGSGQYVWALLEGWQTPGPPPDAALRASLEEEAPETLHRRLAAMDPEAASAIHPHNLRRLVRAIEVRQGQGQSTLVPRPDTRMKSPRYRPLVIGLTLERDALYRRIDRRVDEMMESGLLDEVRLLLQQGYGPRLPAMHSTGYRELTQHLQGELGLSEAVQQVKLATHRLARRQYAWFKLSDTRIRWIDASTDPYDRAAGMVRRFLAGEPCCDTIPE